MLPVKTAAALLVFLFCCAAAAADYLQMKSGESKRGKILTENEKEILFDPEGDAGVVEVLKSQVSILERESPDKAPGSLSFFSSPPKKPRPIPVKPLPPAPIDGLGKRLAEEGPLDKMLYNMDENALLQKLDRLFQKWMEKNPQMKEWFEGMAKKSISQSSQLDDLVKAAKNEN